MREIRIFVDQSLVADTAIELPGAAAHHVARVLRLKAGQSLTLFNGLGGQYHGVIERIDGRKVYVAVGVHEPLEREGPLAITLAQAISRGKRMDYTLQKAVELGVSHIVPLLTEHGQVRLDSGKQLESKMEHWRGIVIAACEQSGRNRLPVIDHPQVLGQWLTTAAGKDLRLLLDPTAGRRLRELSAPAAGLCLLAGPEGGFSPTERDAAVDAGYVPVGLGPRVLRTETAAPAAITACQALWGDLG